MPTTDTRRRDEERERLTRLVGFKIVAVTDAEDHDVSPTLILEREGELFHEVVELYKWHEFGGVNVRTFYGTEDLAEVPAEVV